MTNTTPKTVESWGLSELLAVLCQVAQDAGKAERASKMVEGLRIACDLPATDDGGRRP
jgi:hypothetical protein